jgi:D-alanine-D-alanine ligase
MFLEVKVQGKQIDVVVLYGGRSTEHVISCRSARFILSNLDRQKYRVHAIGIAADGEWWRQDVEGILATKAGPLPVTKTGKALSVGDFGISADSLVVFPILHGTFGEDGTIQGWMELKEIAFVGPDTLGSAIGIDKVIAKKLAVSAGVPVVPWVDFRSHQWKNAKSEICANALDVLGLPLFVKPARLGSSVGVSKVSSYQELVSACEHALKFDDKILIEKGLDVREIEVAALGGYEPALSIAGEVVPHADFYSYDAKYTKIDGASVVVPANLTASQLKDAQDLARQIYKALELYGMSRIDLFLEKSTGNFYFNEVNTIPGFTEISQYPLLWRESGVSAESLLDQLIDSAVLRKHDKQRLMRVK